MRKIYFILSILILLSACKKEINYSDLQKEDIENPEFDSEKMDITVGTRRRYRVPVRYRPSFQWD